MSGVNPRNVRGSRTGVFVGCSASDSYDAWAAVEADRITGYEMGGCCRSMLANRLSYFFDFRGLCFVLYSLLITERKVAPQYCGEVLFCHRGSHAPR